MHDMRAEKCKSRRYIVVLSIIKTANASRSSSSLSPAHIWSLDMRGEPSREA